MGLHEPHPGGMCVKLRGHYAPSSVPHLQSLPVPLEVKPYIDQQVLQDTFLTLITSSLTTFPLLTPQSPCAPGTYHACSYLPSISFPQASRYCASSPPLNICSHVLFWMRPFLTTVFQNCLPVAKSLSLFPDFCIHPFFTIVHTAQFNVVFHFLDYHPQLTCKQGNLVCLWYLGQHHTEGA